jgi:hypothetical protein
MTRFHLYLKFICQKHKIEKGIIAIATASPLHPVLVYFICNALFWVTWDNLDRKALSCYRWWFETYSRKDTLVEQVLLTLPEHISYPTQFSVVYQGVGVDRNIWVRGSVKFLKHTSKITTMTRFQLYLKFICQKHKIEKGIIAIATASPLHPVLVYFIWCFKNLTLPRTHTVRSTPTPLRYTSGAGTAYTSGTHQLPHPVFSSVR